MNACTCSYLLLKHRREALYTWKTRNGSKATYSKLIKIFGRAGYKTYADELRRIIDCENDDSSGSGEEPSQVEQPQTYPDYKQQALSQLSPATSKSTEVFVVVEEKNLPDGNSW